MYICVYEQMQTKRSPYNTCTDTSCTWQWLELYKLAYLIIKSPICYVYMQYSQHGTNNYTVSIQEHENVYNLLQTHILSCPMTR